MNGTVKEPFLLVTWFDSFHSVLWEARAVRQILDKYQDETRALRKEREEVRTVVHYNVKSQLWSQ